MSESRSHRVDPLVMLRRRAERLEGGTLPIGAFITWFTSLEWEDLMAADSAALRLGWDIQNILYQHADDPHDVTESVAIEAIAETWGHFTTQSGWQAAAGIVPEAASHSR